MRLRRLYTETIKRFEPEIQEDLLREMPHTRFGYKVPAELSMLAGSWADLNFESLGLPREEQAMLLRAFGGEGVRIPGSDLKLRFSGVLGLTEIETADGSEPVLPEHWLEVVYIVDGDDLTYFGKRLRPEQLPSDLDMAKYEDIGPGWFLRR